MKIEIPDIAYDLKAQIQHKLDNKAKPVGSLGKLEDMALRIGQMQNSLSPKFNKPVMLVVASDHNITEEGVSPCPVEITWQQVKNFLVGGAGIGLFANLYAMDLWVADAGVNYDFESHPKLLDVKVRKGSRNFLHEPAMSKVECLQAIENGQKIVDDFHSNGTNVIGFGEMGIGNTSPATALLSVFANIPVEESVGPGAGLKPEGISHKANVLKKAIAKHGVSNDPIENLARFGGLEIATLCGAMLQAAKHQMVIVTDGFITTSALLVAQAINPKVLDYVFYSHQSQEQGHIKMIEYMKGEAILNLDLRLGEGTGAAIAYSVLKGAVAVLTDMTSFDEGDVTNTSHIKI